jgi:hypothetical protein
MEEAESQRSRRSQRSRDGSYEEQAPVNVGVDYGPLNRWAQRPRGAKSKIALGTLRILRLCWMLDALMLPLFSTTGLCG